jgi:hypothetical protein
VPDRDRARVSRAPRLRGRPVLRNDRARADRATRGGLAPRLAGAPGAGHRGGRRRP